MPRALILRKVKQVPQAAGSCDPAACIKTAALGGLAALRSPASWPQTAHVTAIEPMGKSPLGTILRYDYEVGDEKDPFGTVPIRGQPGKTRSSVQSYAEMRRSLDSLLGNLDLVPARYYPADEALLGNRIRAPQ